MEIATLAVLHAVPTLLMTGVIWTVQVVHYPLFLRVGAEAFADYEAAHCRRITFVVMPLMLLEVAASVLLLASATTPMLRGLAATGLLLLALLWTSTFALQVPCHRRLERGFDAPAVRRLVATNWLRTVGWTLRAALAVELLLA